MATPSPVPEIKTWSDLLEYVENSSGVCSIPMETLRRLEGAERLGRHILIAIGNRLASHNLGHFPEELPNRQTESVLLYRYGAPASDIVQTIKSAAQHGSIDPGDAVLLQRLQDLNRRPDPRQVVIPEELEDTTETAVGALRALLDQLNPGDPPDVGDKNGRKRLTA